MSKTPNVVINATSVDLGSDRKVLSGVLIGKPVLPVVQDHSTSDFITRREASQASKRPGRLLPRSIHHDPFSVRPDSAYFTQMQ